MAGKITELNEMKRLPRRQVCCALATGATALAGRVNALEATDLMAFSVGPLSLRPRVSVGERYDDNIFYRASGPARKGDSISVFGPGLALTLGHQEANNPWLDLSGAELENYLSVAYDWERDFYASHRDLNTSDHSFQFNGRLKGYRLTLEGSDRIRLLTGVIGGGTNLGIPVRRTTYSDAYTLSYRLTQKSMVYLAGAYSADDFAGGTPLLDDNTVRGTFGFDYLPFTKTSLFGEVYYGQSAISPNRPGDPDGPHETFLGGFAGIRGQFTTRLRGSIKAGYETRQFANHSPVGDSPVVEANLTYRFREKTMFTLGYTRATAVSVQAASVSYGLDSVNLQIDQKIGNSDKWMATFGGYFQTSSFDKTGVYANRTDDWANLGVGLTYLVRVWLRASLGYQFERFNSNYANKGVIDYVANRVTLRVAVGF